ncbi:cilia- and flagella-associated protein 119 isoform X2 [Mixophyes fleayi]
MFLSLDGSRCEPHASVLLDLYYYTVRFCWQCSFTREQTSCVFSIMKETHAACVGTPLENVEDCYIYFKELLLCHAVHQPPFCINLFTQKQILRISDYFLNTYFRHFKLYKYVFTPQVKLDLSISYGGIPDPKETCEQESREADIPGEETGHVSTCGVESDGIMEQQGNCREGSVQENIDQLREEVRPQPNGGNFPEDTPGALWEYTDQRLKEQVVEKWHQSEENVQGRIQEKVETSGRFGGGRSAGKRRSAKAK